MTEYAELKNSAYKKRQALLKGDTLTEVFTRDIEENPFEKGFFLKLLS